MPEEIPVCIAGMWAAHPNIVRHEFWGTARWLVLPLCILGVVISDGMLYAIGRIWGTRLLDTRFFRRMVPPEKRARIEENIHKHGIKVLLFARLLPGIRSPIFITAGTMRLPLTKFILADGIYAIPGVSLLFFLAYWGQQTFFNLLTKIEKKYSAYREYVILALIALIVLYLIYHFLRHPVSEGDPDEEVPKLPLPVIGLDRKHVKEEAEQDKKGDEKQGDGQVEG